MRMNRFLVLPLILALPVAAACGGGGDDDDGGDDDNSTPAAEATSPSGNDGNNAAGIADLDLCPMLTDEEAAEVGSAPETRLGGEGSTYTVTRERGVYTAEQQSIRATSSCRFVIDAGGALAVVEVQATSADNYDTLFKPGGTPIPGIGDDAVNNAGSVYVKVGGVMLSIGEYTASTEFNAEILRRIAPDLR